MDADGLRQRIERLEQLYATRSDIVSEVARTLTARLAAVEQDIALLHVKSGWTNTLISVLALLLSGLITLVVLKR